MRRISRPQVMLSVTRRVGNGIPHPRGGFLYLRSGVSRRVGKGFPTHGGDFTHSQVRLSVTRGVGKGFPTHGGDFTPTGDVKCRKKGGERIPHPRRGFLRLTVRCVKRGGDTDS